MSRVFPPGSSVPKGVGGWLLLLIVMLAVYTPGTGLRALYLDFVVPARLLPALETNPAWVQYRTTVYTFSAIVWAICIATALALWRWHRPVSVWLALAAVWLSCPILPLGYAAAASSAFHTAFSQAVKPFALAIAVSSIHGAIWTGYLLRSVRVRLTYFPGTELSLTIDLTQGVEA